MSRDTQDLFHRLSPQARILFIRLRSMGDCLLLTSPLAALRNEFPRFRLSVLVEGRYASCFDGNPDVADVLVTGSGKFETVRKLLGQRFDAILNLHGGPTSLVYACAARGRAYGLDDYPWSFLYSGLIPRGQTNGHTVEESLGWLKWLGVRTVRPPALNYAGNAEAGAWIEGRVGRDPYVVLHPGGVFETKRWSTEGFRTLGAALNAQGWKVVVTAGPGEGTFASEAARDLDPSLLLLGLTIPQLAELIRGADLFVGNDSGPMHLAAAVGTPVVAVWGSSSAERWHPWRVPHRVVQNRLECNPCSGYRCHVAETPQCIESVTPAQVAEAVWSLAAETGLRSPLATGRGGRAR